MASATLNPSKDNWLDSGNQFDNNGNGVTLFVGRSASGRQHAIFEFDLSGIQAGSTIDSAIFRRFVQGTPASAEPFTIRRCLRPTWSETTSTWNVFRTSNDWTTAGANAIGIGNDVTDENSVSSNFVTGPGYAELSLKSMCQDGLDIDGVLAFVIRRDVETGTSFETLITRTGINSDEHPELVVTWSLPDLPPPTVENPLFFGTNF